MTIASFDPSDPSEYPVGPVGPVRGFDRPVRPFKGGPVGSTDPSGSGVENRASDSVHAPPPERTARYFLAFSSLRFSTQGSDGQHIHRV